MPKLEFGDLNRFIVSVGIALIGGSVGAVWLFLREPFDLLVPAAGLANLTPAAQQVIQNRQQLVAAALTVLPYAASAGILLGTVLIIVGVIRWLPAQRRRDETDTYQQELLRKQLEQMSKEEVVEKARAEVELDTALAMTIAEPPSNEDAVREYLEAEEALLEVLENRLPRDVVMLRHQRLGVHSFDAVIRPQAKDTEYLVEFKRLGPGASPLSIKNALDSLCHAVNWLGFMEEQGPTRFPMVIAVAPSGADRLIEEAERWNAQTAGGAGAHARSLVRIIHPDRLPTLSADDVTDLLDTGERLRVFAEPS